jgi:uncharacterized protein (DUF1697 family)
MPTYVAMLRGINIGTRNRIKMPALEALFTDLGHADVGSYIQSGNVVFKSRSKSTSNLARAIQQRLAHDLGLDIGVIVRSQPELAQVVRDNPFLRRGASVAKLHVTFLADTPDADLVRTLAAFDAGLDEIEVRGREAYLFCPNGYGNTKLNPALIERRLKTVTTTRNWNTVTKLLELAHSR